MPLVLLRGLLIMLKVLRYIEIGQRKYEVGEMIAQADIKAWGMDDVKVQATIAGEADRWADLIK